MSYFGVFTEDEIQFLECQYTYYKGCFLCFVKKIRPELQKTQEARQKLRNMQETDLETKEILKKFDTIFNKFRCPHPKTTYFESPIMKQNRENWENRKKQVEKFYRKNFEKYTANVPYCQRQCSNITNFALQGIKKI